MKKFLSCFSYRNVLVGLIPLFFFFSDTLGRVKRNNGVCRSKEVMIRYTEERVNGVLFAHRVDVVDGVRKERLAINGAVVSEPEYEDALLEAEKAERRIERRRIELLRNKEEAELAQQQDFARTSKLAIERKRLQLILAQIDAELPKIKDPKLVPYYLFGNASFVDAESFTQFCDELLPQARHLVDVENIAAEEVSKTIALLEPQPTRLRSMFRATVNNAINKCDDTRLLKELLEAVA